MENTLLEFQNIIAKKYGFDTFQDLENVSSPFYWIVKFEALESFHNQENNNLAEYLEIHFDVTSVIISEENNGTSDRIIGICETTGKGGLYELSKDLTDKFISLYKDEVWGLELDYSETLEEFLINELNT